MIINILMIVPIVVFILTLMAMILVTLLPEKFHKMYWDWMSRHRKITVIHAAIACIGFVMTMIWLVNISN